MGDFFPEERSPRQGQRLNRKAGEAVKTPGMFAEEEQSFHGGCRTTNLPILVHENARKVHNVTWKDKITNEELYGEYVKLSSIIRGRRLYLAGYSL